MLIGVGTDLATLDHGQVWTAEGEGEGKCWDHHLVVGTLTGSDALTVPGRNNDRIGPSQLGVVQQLNYLPSIQQQQTPSGYGCFVGHDRE